VLRVARRPAGIGLARIGLGPGVRLLDEPGIRRRAHVVLAEALAHLPAGVRGIGDGRGGRAGDEEGEREGAGHDPYTPTWKASHMP
jgi:hypothetical protein